LTLGLIDDYHNWSDAQYLLVNADDFWPDDSPVALNLTFVPTNPPTKDNYGTAILSFSGSNDDNDSPLTWTVDSPVGTSLAISCISINPFAWILQGFNFPLQQWEVKFQNINLNGKQIICDFDVWNGAYSASVSGLTSLPNGFVLTGDITFHFFQSPFWKYLGIFGRALCEVRIERVNTGNVHWPFGNGTPP